MPASINRFANRWNAMLEVSPTGPIDSRPFAIIRG
jgi:hypothetical protein